ncbi:MAG TPA: arsenical resistance operon transcriptional repressor ArsD [Lentisphaeria bacterium]|nr:MAG: hypothetical protein A2X47_03275 [Lentisphaerae bacterium GWF2_38_69]HBM15296.1 arsenical resistance operon transcriptional repressor ArsD [Lentisphaeria bacterium]
MKTLKIYDPPMCCSTGVCGPSVNSELVSFAGTVNGLKKAGINVERYNLSQQPQAFVMNPEVQRFLKEKGQQGLPIIFFNDDVAFEGRYPSRQELLDIVNIDSFPSENCKCKEGSKCCSGN